MIYGGWDLHDNVQNGIRSQLPQFDQGYAALIRDLDRRGLLKSTLVCIASEFGRTPKINGTAGRDHWPKVFTVVMAGGGIKGGIAMVPRMPRRASRRTIPSRSKTGPRRFTTVLASTRDKQADWLRATARSTLSKTERSARNCWCDACVARRRHPKEKAMMLSIA